MILKSPLVAATVGAETVQAAGPSAATADAHEPVQNVVPLNVSAIVEDVDEPVRLV